MKDIAGGDATALARLYDDQSSRLFGIAVHLLRDPQLAEDVLHDVFLEVWRAAADYDPQRGRVSTWLSVRLRSRCLDRLRAAPGRREVSAEGHEESAEAVLDKAHQVQRGGVAGGRELPTGLDDHRVAAALERLPAPQREVVVACYLEGLSREEAADRLGCPVGTVKSRLRRALDALRVLMEPERV